MTSDRPKKSFLILCTLRIGDILLATPLMRSLRKAYPDSRIDVLVLKGMAGVLEGNPDIDGIIESPHRTTLWTRLREWRSLWRRYTHALSPVSSDRARFYAFVAAPQRLGFINSHTSSFSRRLLTHTFLFDDETQHTVPHNLRLLEPLGIPPDCTVVPPSAKGTLPLPLHEKKYAVVHPYPKFTYKSWPLENWIQLVREIQKNALLVVLTGSCAPDEMAVVREISHHTTALNLAGTLSLAETADLIRKAQFFVGPDTGITHMAAATGIPTLTLFGPTNPVKWGPWPATQDCAQQPWHRQGSQHRGNVWIIQGSGPCVPCHQEGCDRHALSKSLCLENLPVSAVLEIIQTLALQP